MSRFSDARIANLIDEVGDYVEFAIRDQISPGDSSKGIPPSYQYLSRRRIKAYIVQRDISVPVAGGQNKFGVMQAYIMGRSIALSEFTNKALIIYQGTVYHIEYQDDIGSQGRIVLHKVQLLSADTYTKVESPDGIIRLPESAPASNPPIVGSPEYIPPQPIIEPASVPFAPL